MSRLRSSRLVDKRIHRAYKSWDGRPMDFTEIAEVSNVDVSTIKATYRRAIEKMRSIATDSPVLEYLEE